MKISVKTHSIYSLDGAVGVVKPLGEKKLKLKKNTLIQKGLAQFGCKCGRKILYKAALTEPRQKKHHKNEEKNGFSSFATF